MGDYANIAVYVVEGLLCFFILYKIFAARLGQNLYIRRIAGLSNLDEAVGRATEMGKPMLFVPGLSGLDIIGLQAMAVLSHVTKHAAKYGTRVIVPLADAVLYTVAEEVSKDAYISAGRPDLFNIDDIRYLSGRQFAWASGVIGTMYREQVATIFYFGYFAAEALVLSENGQQAGAIQIAGTTETTQVPFLLASCDYTIIGEEYYATSAYLSREPTLLGSLVGQDWSKILIVALIILGSVSATLALVMPGSAIAHFLHCHFFKFFVE